MRTEPALRHRCRGFTLIEVLAALVIVALGMLGVIEAVTQTARNGTYLREKTLAHWVAMNVVTERRLQPSAPEVAESSDEVDLAGQRWHWTLTVTQTDVASMRRMDVKVRRADAPEDSSLASLSAFYGSAVRAGGPPMSWDNEGQPGDGGDEGDDEGDGDGGKNPKDPKDPQDPPDPGDGGDGSDGNPDGIPGGGDNPGTTQPPEETGNETEN